MSSEPVSRSPVETGSRGADPVDERPATHRPSRVPLVALALYAVLAVSTLTPLYGPFYSGRDDSWAVLVLLAAAHLGLGIAVPRAAVLLLPLGLAVAAFVLQGAEGLAVLLLLFGAPILLAITAIGLGLGRGAGPRAWWISGVPFAIAALPAAWALSEHAQRTTHLPAAVQAQLPTQISLSNLCRGTATRPALVRDLRRRADALVRELRERPDHLLTYTHYYSDLPPERRAITVRELAEEQLRNLDPRDLDPSDPGCGGVSRRLEEAL